MRIQRRARSQCRRPVGATVLCLTSLVLPLGCVEPASDSVGAEQVQSSVVAVGAPEVTVRARHSELVRLPDPQVVEPEVAGERERFGGVGLVLSERDNGLFVIEVAPGTASEVAGIQPGDRIVGVAGRPIAELTLADVVETLRGEPGTVVALETVRPSGEPAAHRLERGLITVEAEEHHAVEYGGIGASLGGGHGEVVVGRVFPGSGAERAGLQAGDRVVAVDSQPMRDLPLAAVTNLLRGEPGTAVELLIQSAGDAEPRMVRVERQIVVLP